MLKASDFDHVHRRGRGVFIASLLAVAHVHAADNDWVYVARPGDTLIGIATQYCANAAVWPQVQQINGIADPRRLQPGMQLRIPLKLLKPAPAATEVLLVNGEAVRIAAAGGTETPLVAGVRLNAGDTLRVGSGSNMTLRFPDGSRLLVTENSKLVLTRSARRGGSDLYRIQVELLEGSVDSLVNPFKGRGAQYEIKAPALRMGVRGTEFRASVDPVSKLTRGEVLAGVVKMAGQGQTLTLGKGYGTVASIGRPPAPARTLLAAPALERLPVKLDRVPLRFSWEAVAAARAYRAQVLDQAGRLVLDGVFPEATAKWADIPDAAYTLRVRAIAADGLEGMDAQHAFTLKARPEPPFAAAPLDKAYGEPTRFAWTQSGGASTYHFQLATDAEFEHLVVDAAAVNADHLTYPVPLGRHYWRVASVSAAADQGPFGTVQAFEQKPVPACPSVATPELDAKQLTFRWQAGEPGQRYLLQLARSADFAELVAEHTTSESTIALPRPDAGDYFMRVKAIDADGFAGPFGAPQRLTVPGSTWWYYLPLLLIPLVL